MGIISSGSVLWSRSRTFFAGAGAGEKARLRAYGYCGGKVATIQIKFSHFLKIYTQIEGKNRYTFKQAKLFTLVFKTAFFT